MKTAEQIRPIRLAQLVKQCGGVVGVAAVLKRSSSQVSQWLNQSLDSKSGKPRTISNASARYIEKCFDKPAGWMDSLDEDSAPVESAAEGFDSGATRVVIPMSSAWGSMGKGAPRPEHEIIVGGIPVGAEWLRHMLPRTSSPNNLAAITAFGESMAPTFKDGDTLIVDRGVERIQEDGLFVLSLDDELYIKRVQRRPTDRAILMKSDNPLYETIVIESVERQRFEVLGRVVWVWKGEKV